MRLGKKDKIKFDENKINEHLLCLTDKVRRLEGCFVDNNLKIPVSGLKSITYMLKWNPLDISKMLKNLKKDCYGINYL